MKENQMKTETKPYGYQQAPLSPVHIVVKATWNKLPQGKIIKLEMQQGCAMK